MPRQKKQTEVEIDGDKLAVSFALGRGRTVFVTGQYDQHLTPQDDRLRYLDIVHQFAMELALELIANYDAKLNKVVMCEVDPGMILFEIETNATATVRKKAIEAVQRNVEKAMEEDGDDHPVDPMKRDITMNGPDGMQ